MKPFFLQDSLKFDLGLYILEAGNSERCVIGYDGVFWGDLASPYNRKTTSTTAAAGQTACGATECHKLGRWPPAAGCSHDYRDRPGPGR